jgi:hypothetical protein
VRLVTVKGILLVKRMWLPTSAWRATLLEAVAVVAAVVVVGAVIAATPADGAAVRRSTISAPADRPAAGAPASSPAPDRFFPSGETAMLVVGCVLMGLGAVLRRREAPDDTEEIDRSR